MSGGHLNPAVSVAVATLGKFPWWKVLSASSLHVDANTDTQVPHYMLAQYLGAFTASAAVFLVYWDALVW